MELTDFKRTKENFKLIKINLANDDVGQTYEKIFTFERLEEVLDDVGTPEHIDETPFRWCRFHHEDGMLHMQTAAYPDGARVMSGYFTTQGKQEKVFDRTIENGTTRWHYARGPWEIVLVEGLVEVERKRDASKNLTEQQTRVLY